MLKRSVKVTFRLNEKECRNLKSNVAKSGLSQENYLRSLIEGYVPKELPPLDYQVLLQGLNAIGNNLNQMKQTVCAVRCRKFRRRSPRRKGWKMKRQEKLLKRLDRNYADYRAKVARMDTQEIFQKAVEIASTKEMYEYLSDRHHYESEQIDYLLRFQNPLEVLRDQYVSICWNKDNTLENIVQTACDKQEALADYPLMKPPQEKER